MKKTAVLLDLGFALHKLERALMMLTDNESALDSSGGALVLPVSNEIRSRLIDEAGNCSDQWTLAASILEAHFGIEEKPKKPAAKRGNNVLAFPSPDEVNRTLRDIERLSEDDDDE